MDLNVGPLFTQGIDDPHQVIIDGMAS